ncbi:hypothetical protein OsccyDRAFT_3370 [Leptolyngbyaceae cyanobacterium JSC-12]|nr:hypothetical protein OsccyDRAFT_3370 [Leptolyngbyaceae cyanobacterium JSC-12]
MNAYSFCEHTLRGLFEQIARIALDERLWVKAWFEFT